MASNNASVHHDRLQVNELEVKQLRLTQDWAKFTPTLTTGAFGTTTTNRWRRRIVGNTVDIKATVVVTAAGTLGSGSYQFVLPSGCLAADIRQIGGVATLTGATKSYNCTVSMNADTQQFIVVINNPTSTTPALLAWSATSDAEVRLDAAAGFTLALSASFELDPASPILQKYQ